MAINDQATVDPSVHVTILKLRVKGCILFTLHVMYKNNKHSHNRIEIIEIDRQQSKLNRIARNMNCYTPSL